MEFKRTQLATLVVFLGVLSSANCFLPLLSSEPSDCDMECELEDSPVCGNDGRTYESRCEIDRAKCQGHPVEFKHRGKCIEKARCAAQRALLLEQGNQMGLFVPLCKPDGSYAEVQCHTSTGYCWCVDEAGKPVRGSSSQHERPNCSPKGKKMNRRRSSSRGRKNKKGCGTNDRSSFNANLIDIFQSEYNGMPHTTPVEPVESDPLRDTHEKQVVQWKFDQLDGNGDSFLKKRELRDLRRMAKKIVKPRLCAKTFTKFCDLDRDKRISRSEWSVCVGVDINNEQVKAVGGFLDDSPNVDQDSSTGSLPVQSDDWDKEHEMPHLRHDGHVLNKDTAEEDSKEAELPDCKTAKRVATDNHRQDPTAGIFIPDCSPEGNYVRTQCHKSPQLCWCVNPKTGRPLKGSTAQGFRPDCDKKQGKNFKGCSLHKRQEFMDELVNSFTKEMQEDAKNRSVTIDPPTPEKAARWKFASIDTNNNTMLDKREWKAFKGKEWRSFSRQDGKQKKRLRKCWRNLPRFCDENDNQKITMDEWLACTSIIRDFKGMPQNPQRKGKNPFSTILKSD